MAFRLCSSLLVLVDPLAVASPVAMAFVLLEAVVLVSPSVEPISRLVTVLLLALSKVTDLSLLH